MAVEEPLAGEAEAEAPAAVAAVAAVEVAGGHSLRPKEETLQIEAGLVATAEQAAKAGPEVPVASAPLAELDLRAVAR